MEKGATAAACLWWAHKGTRAVPPQPTSPEGIPPSTPGSPLIIPPRPCQSRSSPSPSLRPAPSALGPTHLRLRAGAVGTGWPWLWAWLWPGGGAALLRAGSMPAGARPGRTAGLPMYGEPGGPMGAPWWGIRAPDGIPGRWGGGGGRERSRNRRPWVRPGPGSRRGEPRLPHPKPPAGDPDAAGVSEGGRGRGAGTAPLWRRGLCVSLQEAN